MAPSLKAAFAHYSRGQTTVRTENWRLFEHRPEEETEGFELFDFRENTLGERKNPNEYPNIVEQLSKQLESISQF